MNQLLLVVEGPSDFQRVRFVVDAHAAGSGIEFVGPDESSSYLKRKDVAKYATGSRFRMSKPGLAGELRRLLLYVRQLRQTRAVAGVIVVVDSEGRTDQPTEDDIRGLVGETAMGVAHESLESWLLEGYCPTDEERRDERKRLGFDPFRTPEELSHKKGVKKSAKDLLRRLALDEEACFVRLYEAGGSDTTGSGPFLRALRQVLSDLAA